MVPECEDCARLSADDQSPIASSSAAVLTTSCWAPTRSARLCCSFSAVCRSTCRTQLNLLPAALTGIGLGWLLMGARQQSSAQTRYREVYRDPADEYVPVAPKYLPRDTAEGSDSASTGEVIGRARDKVG